MALVKAERENQTKTAVEWSPSGRGPSITRRSRPVFGRLRGGRWTFKHPSGYGGHTRTMQIKRRNTACLFEHFMSLWPY